MKIFALIFGLLLTGCVSHEHHGHYKINDQLLKKGLSKQEIINNYGTPFVLNTNPNVVYYMYSKVKKYSIGSVDEKETKIIRIVFENNLVKNYEIFEYSDYVPNEKRTKEPEMKLNLFAEIIGDIGGVVGADSISESSKKFKSSDKSPTN